MATVIGIRFKKAGKVYYFSPGEVWPRPGENVIVETTRGVELGEARVTRKLRIAERDIAHAELMRLSKHGIDAGVGREGDYLQLVGVPTGHIECLRADRARRSQNNNFTRHAAFIRMSRISHFKPPLIRSESKALPRQKPMSRAPEARFRRRGKSRPAQHAPSKAAQNESRLHSTRHPGQPIRERS